jgi:hypothetical protein
MVSAVALAVPWVAWAGAAKPKAEQFKCAKCRDTKRVPCTAHDRSSRLYKPFCSACPEPACCRGVGWTPCPDCADDATKKEFEDAAATFARERNGECFYPWGEKLFCAACEHYRFKGSMTHPEAHEFHAVAEKAFSLFQRIFGEEGVGQIQWDKKGHILLFASRDQYHEFLDWYKKSRNVNENEIEFLKGGQGARLISDRLQAIIRAESRGAGEDKATILHRVAHGAGHLAIENYFVHGNTPDWLGEGWACLSEITALGQPRVYCIQYVAGGPGQRPPHEWRQTVREAILKKTIPSFEKLFALKVGEMGVVEWSMSISVVAWLTDRFPRKAVRLVKAVKEGKASKEAFEAVFETDVATIEKEWQRWARTAR